MRVKLESPLRKGKGRPVFRVVINVHHGGYSVHAHCVCQSFGCIEANKVARASMVSTVLTENVNKYVHFGYLGGPEGVFNYQTGPILLSSYPLTHI